MSDPRTQAPHRPQSPINLLNFHPPLSITPLTTATIDTPLGPMIAMANDKRLYLLEFTDRKALPKEVKRLRDKTKCAIVTGTTTVIDLLQEELKDYFAGKLQQFTLPLGLLGTPFQKAVWQGLIDVPYGETRSYLRQTLALGYAKHKVRAVAGANGANQLAIIIPCHRIINESGALGGYGGGLARKRWLLAHEKRHRKSLLEHLMGCK